MSIKLISIIYFCILIVSIKKRNKTNAECQKEYQVPTDQKRKKNVLSNEFIKS